MKMGAQTPEELETLFEDVFLMGDREALVELFEVGAVLAADDGRREARGGDEIACLASDLWTGGRAFFADPRRVFQARDTALVVAERSLGVVRRGGDGRWRYAISVLSLENTNRMEER